MQKILLLLLTLSFPLFAQKVLLNEIMPSNSSSIADEDGDFSDWIEIYNNNESSINLAGFGLSDNPANLYKWIIPQYILQPHKHILIFASEKNKTDATFWQPIIVWGDFWKYFLGTSEPPAQWKNLGFADNNWQSGKSGFGYGDNDDSTIVPLVQSLYLRKTFTIEDANDIMKAVLHVDYDDAFVAYLNGVEIARSNIGAIGTPPPYNQSASTAKEALIYSGGKPEAFDLQRFISLFKTGENVLAIQVHNYGTASSDMSLIPFLTLGFKSIPSTFKTVNPLLDLPDNFFHTNFKLNADGGSVYLTNPQSGIVDQVSLGSIPTNVSYGRKTDGDSLWNYFLESTPGKSNIGLGYTGLSGEPIFSLAGGFYTGAINISLTPSVPGTIIYYTLDGSEPKTTSTRYTSPISITSPKVLRAMEVGQNLIPGQIVTNTYLINISNKLPVFSISTDPGNLFDNDYGIYVLGDSAESVEPYYGANYWNDWERPIHIELFDTNGTGFSMDAGIKIFGGWSRRYDQKSLAIYARSIYGSGKIKYKLFNDLPFTEYESFILRNGGNDWQHTLLRDPLSAELLEGTSVDKQAYRPVVLFLNGQYWGIHQLREKINEHFLSDHHNVDPDSVDLLELNGLVINGDNSDYIKLYIFISSNNLAIQSNYEYVKSKMDMDSFIDYFVSEIYFDNTDWPVNNIKFWRKSVTGKWRWILFDTDFGYGLYDQLGYQHNTLSFATSTNGPAWPNPPSSTLLLRKLLENISFKNDFVNRFADFMNTRFSVQNVTNQITKLKSAIAPEISRQSARWNQFNPSSWETNVQRIYDFANKRLDYLQLYFTQKFSLPGLKPVGIVNNDTSAGFVQLNSLTLKTPAFSGAYFMNIPIKIIAVPKRGYKFVRWEGSIQSVEDTLTIPLSYFLNLFPVFKKDESFSVPKVVINEINYNSSLDFNPEDWVELYNNSDTVVNISGWSFKDEEDIHSLTFPSGTLLNPRSYLVLCRDSVLFKNMFPDVKIYNGNLSFGFSSGGELLRLYDESMNIIDSLTYGDSIPWPVEPDGNGSTLELKNPDSDNSIAANWASSFNHGTPGKRNDNFTGINDHEATKILSDYSLIQNYPNPFNPSTIIKFAVPKTEIVSLKVYDILGKEIATLINKQLSPGNYEQEFNAAHLSSGVYFYRITAGNFTAVRKMQVIK